MSKNGLCEPELLPGAEFRITTAAGCEVGLDGVIGTSTMTQNGIFTTDSQGEIRITNLAPGAYVLSEIEAPDGYVIDTPSTNVVIGQGGDTQTVVVKNTKKGALIVEKYDSVTKQPLSGAQFKITTASGELVADNEGLTSSKGLYRTDKNGEIRIFGITGTLIIQETETIPGYVLNKYSRRVKVNANDVQTVTFYNAPLGGVELIKVDAADKSKRLSGAVFEIRKMNDALVDTVTTGKTGRVYADLDAGSYYALEIEAPKGYKLDNPGYVPDTQLKTVYVKAGETTLVEWQNIPITAQIQITKKSADYNSVNGLPAGSLLEGAVFEIRDKAGNLVDTIKSDKNGVAASKPLPLGRYFIKETKAPANYSASDKELTAYLEHAGQIMRFEVTNKSVALGVAIKKTGYAEVMPGQNIRYTFSDIGNTSSVPLQSFYWRDTLPVQAVRLHKIITGTYSAPGSYKILYKTNLSNGEYRTMYDNLSTAKSYDLACGPAALGLASNEYVTEFLFEFGVVPAGFHQVEAPKVDCTVLPTVQGGSQFVNHADVGGSYNGRWLQAVTRWVTKVYGKPIIPTLPKTGY